MSGRQAGIFILDSSSVGGWDTMGPATPAPHLEWKTEAQRAVILHFVKCLCSADTKDFLMVKYHVYSKHLSGYSAFYVIRSGGKTAGGYKTRSPSRTERGQPTDTLPDRPRTHKPRGPWPSAWEGLGSHGCSWGLPLSLRVLSQGGAMQTRPSLRLFIPTTEPGSFQRNHRAKWFCRCERNVSGDRNVQAPDRRDYGSPRL